MQGKFNKKKIIRIAVIAGVVVIVLITHDNEVAVQAARRIQIRDGHVREVE